MQSFAHMAVVACIDRLGIPSLALQGLGDTTGLQNYELHPQMRAVHGTFYAASTVGILFTP